MITVDSLARELGCTLSDLTEISSGSISRWNQDLPMSDAFAAEIRAKWSKRTGIDYTDNELIRATTLDHRVKAIRAEADFYVLECTCGHRLTSNSIVPEAARRRLYKSHALHVATCLMTVEAGE